MTHLPGDESMICLLRSVPTPHVRSPFLQAPGTPIVARHMAPLTVTKQGSPTPVSAPATTTLQRPPILQVHHSTSGIFPRIWTKEYPLLNAQCFYTVLYVLLVMILVNYMSCDIAAT